MSEGELILYAASDGTARIQLRTQGGTVWLSLTQITDLFGRDKSVISRHIKSVLEEGELDAGAVVAQYATTAADGKTYQVDHYRLESTTTSSSSSVGSVEATGASENSRYTGPWGPSLRIERMLLIVLVASSQFSAVLRPLS